MLAVASSAIYQMGVGRPACRFKMNVDMCENIGSVEDAMMFKGMGSGGMMESRRRRRRLLSEAPVWQMNHSMGGPEDQDCQEGTPIEECADTWVEYAIDVYGHGVVESIGDFVRPGRGQDLHDFMDFESPHDYVVTASEAISECIEGMDIQGSGNWDRKDAQNALVDAFLRAY